MYLVQINTIYKPFVHYNDRWASRNELFLSKEHIESSYYCLLFTQSGYDLYFIPSYYFHEMK